MRRIMAVCDADSCYAGRFAEVANRVKSIPFEVVAFTSLARLKEFTEKEQVELLLMGDDAEEADLTDVKVERVIRLSEEGTVKDDRPAIYKYQSSDSVLREVMACCQVWEQPFTSQTVRSKSRVLGVYSPLSRCGKTSFAFTLGQVLAQNGKALLLSLEECSGLSKLTATVYGSTLSDVLYYYRQGEYSRLRLSSSIYSWGGLDYVPPVTYAEDLAGLRGNEVAGLVGAIAADGMYEAIVVDLGHFTGGIEDARNNAKINGLENAEFFVGKAEEVLPAYYEEYGRKHSGRGAHADVIVVDPPRKGCEEALLKTMVDMEPERIVYVSCDSATLSRDVKYLRERGYELEKVRAVDQFPHTVHVETVVLMSRKVE